MRFHNVHSKMCQFEAQAYICEPVRAHLRPSNNQIFHQFSHRLPSPLHINATMSLPSSFKAAVVPEAGAQHKVVDRSLAPLAADEVAVKVTATAINPVDWKMRDYRIFIASYPTVLGSDAAGEIVAVGSSVTSHSVGERVFFQGIIGQIDSSTFQQYVKIPASLVAKTPRRYPMSRLLPSGLAPWP